MIILLGGLSPYLKYDVADSTAWVQSVYIQQLSWSIAIFLIVLVILLFYVRLFPTKRMRRAICALGVWSVVWTIYTFVGLALQCHPVRYFWDKDIAGGRCINSDAFYFATGLLSTITIMFVLAMPLPVIWNLQVTTSKKIGLAFSFSAGALYECFQRLSDSDPLLTLRLVKQRPSHKHHPPCDTSQYRS